MPSDYKVPINKRHIVHGDGFTEKLNALIPDAQVQDFVSRACIEVIAQYPHAGHEIENGLWMYWTKREIQWIPPLIIYYKFDDHKVDLIDVKETNLPDNE